MATKRLTIPVLTCARCGHQWVPRKVPVYLCPRKTCHTPKWQERKA